MKSKHLTMILLACILCLISVYAFADVTGDEDIFTSAYISTYIQGESSVGIQNIAWVNDKCYAYLSDMSVYVWSTVEPLQKLCQLPPAPEGMQSSYINLSDTDIAMLKDTITYTVAGSDGLWGFNVFSGKFGNIDSEGLHWSSTTLDFACLNPEENFFPNRVAECFIVNNTLFTFVSLSSGFSDESYALYGFDLNNGTSKSYTIDTAVGLCYMEDTKFILLCTDSDGYCLKQLDTSTDTLTMLPISMNEISLATAVGGLAYDKDSRTIALAADGKVYKSIQDASFAPVANISTRGLLGETTAALLSDGRYALWLNGVHIRSQSNQEESKQLTCQLPVLSNALETNFSNAYPDIALTVRTKATTAEELATLLTTRDSSVDLFEIRADYSYSALKQKGLIASLSSDYLKQNLYDMYSIIQDVLIDKNGNLVAYPSRLYVYLYQYNKGFWDLAFDGEEFPSSLDSLMDYWLRWEQEYADDYPEIEFVDNYDYATCCRDIIVMYIRQHDSPDQVPDLYSDDLRTVLEKLRRVNDIRQAAGRHTSALSMDEYDGKACIFRISTREAMNAPASFYATSSEEYLYDIYMYDYSNVSMKFSEHDDLNADGILYVYVINPYSSHQAEAQKFIETASVMEINPYLYYAIHPQCNAPYENPNFAGIIEQYSKEKAYLEGLKEKAEGQARDEIDYLLDYYDKYLNDQEHQRWMISADTIAESRKKLQNINLHATSFFLGASGTAAYDMISELCTRYCSGLMSLDTFLHDMTNKVHMMQLESN